MNNELYSTETGPKGPILLQLGELAIPSNDSVTNDFALHTVTGKLPEKQLLVKASLSNGVELNINEGNLPSKRLKERSMLTRDELAAFDTIDPVRKLFDKINVFNVDICQTL
jgi:hypothetical protein